MVMQDRLKCLNGIAAEAQVVQPRTTQELNEVILVERAIKILEDFVRSK